MKKEGKHRYHDTVWTTQRQKECACSVNLAHVIPAWMNFVEERIEHRFTLFWTDIDVIRPENLMEFVLMENSEG